MHFSTKIFCPTHFSHRHFGLHGTKMKTLYNCTPHTILIQSRGGGTKLWYEAIGHFYVFLGNWLFGPTTPKLVSIPTCILILKSHTATDIDMNCYLMKWSSLTTYKPEKLNHKSLLWIYNITIETVQACIGNCLNNLIIEMNNNNKLIKKVHFELFK